MVVVDCAPTAETLRLLSLPEVLGWWMERLFPITRQVSRLLGPVVRQLAAVPVPSDVVFGTADRLYQRLADVRDLLGDGDVTSVRLVVNPERVVIAEARRTATYLALFGYRVDAVIVNRLLPARGDRPVVRPAPRRPGRAPRHHRGGLRARAGAALQPGRPRAGRGRAAGAVRRAPSTATTIRPPTSRRARSWTSAGRTRRGCWPCTLPFTDRRDVGLVRRGDELIVSVGPYRRALLLPDSLAGRKVVDASVKHGRLRVVFADRPGGRVPAAKVASGSGRT